MLISTTLLTGLLEESATNRSESVAMEDSERTVRFAAVRRAARRVAASLAAAGVAPGDRVVLLMGNSVGFGVAFWGVLYAGAVAVPLHPGTKSEKLRWIIGNCTPTALLHDAALEEVVHAACAGAPMAPVRLAHGGPSAPCALDDLIDCDDGIAAAAWPAPGGVIDQDLAAIIYTSGSTGEPKGVMLSHLNMTSAARSVAQYLGYTETDCVFCTIPLTFDYGLHQLTMTTLVGARLRIDPSFAQPFFALQRLARSRASVFPVVPTMVPLIAPFAERFDLSSVRSVTSTAAALRTDSIDQLSAMFPGARIFSMYGLTECHRCTYLDPAELSRRKTSVGKAIPNTELWVIDAAGRAQRRNAVGELVIRGSTVMMGYWNNPAKTAEKLRPGLRPGELVLHTGDTCRLDADGFLYFVSRSDEVLKVAGEKVVPNEVEAVLAAHPLVLEACALGVEHPVYGQQCCAVVTLRAGAAPDEAALRAWCAERLERHAVPARVLVRDALPRTPNGKFDRLCLREAFIAPAPAMRASAPSPVPSLV